MYKPTRLSKEVCMKFIVIKKGTRVKKPKEVACTGVLF